MRMKVVGMWAAALWFGVAAAGVLAQDTSAQTPQQPSGTLGNDVSFDPNQPIKPGFDISVTTSSEAGIETYCLTPVGAKSTLVREFEDDPRRVFANNAFDAENLVLAVRMHASLLNASGRKDRGVRRARFMTVLREQKRPAVLLEGGYLSHPTESQLILQEEFREKLAQAVVNGLPRDY